MSVDDKVEAANAYIYNGKDDWHTLMSALGCKKRNLNG